MFVVEGLTLQASTIPHRQLVACWRHISRKPMPRVKALRLSDADFNHVLENRDCLEDQLREVEEWGHVLSHSGTDACIYNADQGDDCDFVILIRQNPYHSLEAILLHELWHIVRGDL
jgi:hypothetical protein